MVAAVKSTVVDEIVSPRPYKARPRACRGLPKEAAMCRRLPPVISRAVCLLRAVCLAAILAATLGEISLRPVGASADEGKSESEGENEDAHGSCTE